MRDSSEPGQLDRRRIAALVGVTVRRCQAGTSPEVAEELGVMADSARALASACPDGVHPADTAELSPLGLAFNRVSNLCGQLKLRILTL
jgi:hypothetical protein